MSPAALAELTVYTVIALVVGYFAAPDCEDCGRLAVVPWMIRVAGRRHLRVHCWRCTTQRYRLNKYYRRHRRVPWEPTRGADHE